MIVFLALLGGWAVHTIGAGVMVGALRVTIWEAFAMGLTSGVGLMFEKVL